MFTKYTKNLLATLVLPLIISFAFASQILAQDLIPQLMQVNQLQLKPDKIERFRAIHRDVFMPADRQRGLPWRYTTSTIIGESFQMTVVTPIANMAALDQPAALGATSLEQELSLEIWNTAVVSRRSYIVISRPDMSMEGQPETGITALYRFQVKSGHEPRFVALWNEKVIPALTQSGIKGTQVFQTLAGGKNGEFFSLTPIENFAFMDGGGPFRGLAPEDAAALNVELGLLLDEMEISFTQVDQELSYGLPGLQQ